MFITVSSCQTHCRFACRAPAFTIPWSIRGLYMWLGRKLVFVSLCAASQWREPLFFLQHLPRALILCSGTSHSLCMFACSSAFDGLPGLILAMQSLSQLSNVSLGGACGRKTPAGKNGWRKRSKCSRIRGGVSDFWWHCVVCHSEWEKLKKRTETESVQCRQSPNWPRECTRPKMTMFSLRSYQLKHQLVCFAVQYTVS